MRVGACHGGQSSSWLLRRRPFRTKQTSLKTAPAQAACNIKAAAQRPDS
ncbi:hypothetical protein HMPREF0298_0995 [Corynebacterium lipophiloflavum DSM 44291]|uniref:Uncharacterized protein n=1 Tax=Corynebacterium lipophiloflavum (strain ATCC 700352 / DSM 44291 / CCUG 37336 / JCM 10383 / DMMZ 1944) TaxID=525263 RepID=C0XRC5_CORLD|nr:hypothetical protein HMPREF0298_0995 [Corynebacterium lipophiloflavum DSM 44291]